MQLINKPNLSASSAKTLKQCSWIFKSQYVEKLPERVWAKTKIGTLTHSILECLQNPRHRKYFDRIMLTENIESVTPIARMRDAFYRKNPEVTEKIAADLDSLVLTALKHDFFCAGATKVLPPEFKFQLKFGDMTMKGFMDKVAFYDGYVKVTDYKTQGKRFTDEEMEDNIQAAMYQLAIWEIFKMPAEVEFLMLRFPPNKRDANRHVQTVKPYGEQKLKGLVEYLKFLDVQIKTFDDKAAKANLLAFSDKGFCDFVCGFKTPFKYYATVHSDGKWLKTKQPPTLVSEDAVVTEHQYNGCPYFYNEEGKPRNWK